jgi:PadR family transcriptional regulator PadR
MAKKSGSRDLFPGALESVNLHSPNRKPMHGYALRQRIKDISDDFLQIEQGSLYPALQRMLKTGWLESEMGTSRRGNARCVFLRWLRQAENTWKKNYRASRRCSREIARVLAVAQS